MFTKKTLRFFIDLVVCVLQYYSGTLKESFSVLKNKRIRSIITFYSFTIPFNSINKVDERENVYMHMYEMSIYTLGTSVCVLDWPKFFFFITQKLIKSFRPTGLGQVGKY